MENYKYKVLFRLVLAINRNLLKDLPVHLIVLEQKRKTSQCALIFVGSFMCEKISFQEYFKTSGLSGHFNNHPHFCMKLTCCIAC